MDRKLAVFKNAGAVLVKQSSDYYFKEDGKIMRRKDHVLDTAMYFARQIPGKSQIPMREMEPKDYIKSRWFADKEAESKKPEPTKKQAYVRKFIRRGRR